MPFLNWNKKLDFNTKKLFDSALNSSIRIEEIHRGLKDLTASLSSEWNNLLIQGDNKLVMQTLLKRFRGKINLIYIDPPFFTGGHFHFKTFIGETNSFISKAYSDSWEGGLDAYLNFIYERLLLIKELLSESGSIYLHLDWHVSHYIKILMDEIFGEENFKNEIIWAYPAASVQTRKFYIRSYDTIFFYTKSNNYTFRDDPNIYMEYSNRVKSALKTDEKGIYYYRGGSHNGKKLSRKVYVKDKGIFPRDVWNDIPYIRANTNEYQGFSTQKPERLLKRIILASSNENDLIADFFCGTGTTLVAAEKLDRRWIGCDITPQSIHICRKRILDIKNSNDLINWKKKYKQAHSTFKLLSITNNQNKFHIQREFLQQTKPSISNLTSYKIPDFDISITQQEKSIQIAINNYNIPYIKEINSTLKEQISKFSDWIDYWAIDFNYQGGPMVCDWISFRNPKKRKLHLNSTNFTYETPGAYTIKIKLVNILGHESEKEYTIEI